MLKGGYKAIVVRLGAALVISFLVPGCSVRPLAVDVYRDALRLREQGQNDLAVEKLKEVIEADSGFALAYSELGRAHLGTGDFERAEAVLRKATVLDPWSFPDHVDLARVCQRQGKWAEAAGAYGRAAELAPENLAVQLEIARCYLKAGDLAGALASIELAMQTDGGAPEGFRLLGQVHEAQGDYEQAMAVYRQWSELTPDVPDGMLAMAMVRTRNGAYNEARKILMSVLQKWPREATASRHLAYCLLKLGDTDGAVEMYENAIALEANNWEAHRGLGVAYMVKSRQTADNRLQSLALRHWRQALVIYPDQPRREVLQRLIKEHSTTRNPLQGLDY